MARSSNFSCLAKLLVAITLLAACLSLARFALDGLSGFPRTHSPESSYTKGLIDEINLPFKNRIDNHKSYLTSPRYRSHHFKILTTGGVPDSFFNYESILISGENFGERHQSIWPDLDVLSWSENGDIYWRRTTVEHGNVHLYFCNKSDVLFVTYYRY